MTKRILPEGAIMIPESAKCVFKGEIFDVYQWQQEMFDGSFETFEMLRRPDSTLVIAINDDDSIVTLYQEQPGGILREVGLPGGRVDEEDMTVLDAAKREMLEETGMTFDNWSLVECLQPQPKIEWFVYVFVATNKIKQQSTSHGPGEKIEVKSSSFGELKNKKPGAHELKVWEVNSVEELRNLPDLDH